MKLGRYLIGKDLEEFALVEISPSGVFGKLVGTDGGAFWKELEGLPIVEFLDALGRFCGGCPELCAFKNDQELFPSDFICGETSEELFVEEGKVMRGEKCPKGKSGRIERLKKGL